MPIVTIDGVLGRSDVDAKYARLREEQEEAQ